MPEMTYFVTCCTSRRLPGLALELVANRILAHVRDSDNARDTTTFGFTIMPDHCHWVFRLGHRLSLGRIIARFKARTNVALSEFGLDWQRVFYEHRLTPGEDHEAYALYAFLNPYRAGLIRSGEVWPWWWSGASDLLRFPRLLNPGGTPPPQWVGEPIPSWIRHGE